MFHLGHAYQKSITNLKTMQKILIYQYIICWNIVTIILQYQEVYGIIIEIK